MHHGGSLPPWCIVALEKTGFIYGFFYKCLNTFEILAAGLEKSK